MTRCHIFITIINFYTNNYNFHNVIIWYVSIDKYIVDFFKLDWIKESIILNY